MKARVLIRLFSAILCATLLFCMVPMTLSAEGNATSTEVWNTVNRQYDKSFQKNYYQLLTYEENYAYKLFEQKNNEGGFLKKAGLWVSQKITDTDLDKDSYIKDLTTLLRMMETSFLENSASQAEYKEISIADYADDARKVTVALFGDNFKSIESAYKAFDFAYDLTKSFSERKFTQDEISFLAATSVIHDRQIKILEAIQQNTDKKNLKEAAEEVINICNAKTAYAIHDTLIKNSLKISVTGIQAVLSILEKIGPQKLVKILNTAKSGFGKFAGHILSKINAFSIGWTIGVSAMKASAGEEMEYAREAMSMDHISDALLTEFKTLKSQADKETDAQEKYEKIEDYVTFGEAITLTHLRGEYCYVESHFSEEDTEASEAHYADIDLTLWEISDQLNEILSTQEKLVVHKNFKLYDGFIRPVDQKTEVPDGYIGIYTAEDFQKIYKDSPKEGEREKFNDTNSAKYILMNDIVLTEQQGTTYAFRGILDGNGYTIRNVRTPLFKNLDASIRNLGIEAEVRILVDSPEDIGIIGCSLSTKTLINNCFISGSLLVGAGVHDYGSSFELSIGTFSGSGGIMKNCYNTAAVSVTMKNLSLTVGGLCGETDAGKGDDGSTYNCYNMGEITATSGGGKVFVGGIYGTNYSGEIEYCYNSGSISSTAQREGFSGGIAGKTSYYVTIHDCSNSGDITARCTGTERSFAGGIYGAGEEGAFNCSNTGNITGGKAGGIAGHQWYRGITMDSNEDVFKNCYNAGNVTGTEYAGGITGQNRASVKYSYNSGTITCNATAGALVGKGSTSIKNCYYKADSLPPLADPVETLSEVKELSEEEMQQQASFEGFDFQNIWKMESGEFPTLRFKTNND